MGSRPFDAALPEGRREVFRQHGFAPRQFLFVELETAQVERGQHGAAAGRGRRVGRGAGK